MNAVQNYFAPNTNTGIEPDGDLCYVNDYYSANRIFTKIYTVSEDCGMLSKCARTVRHTNPLTGEYVDVIYCAFKEPVLAGGAIALSLLGFGAFFAWKTSQRAPYSYPNYT